MRSRVSCPGAAARAAARRRGGAWRCAFRAHSLEYRRCALVSRRSAGRLSLNAKLCDAARDPLPPPARGWKIGEARRRSARGGSCCPCRQIRAAGQAPTPEASGQENPLAFGGQTRLRQGRQWGRASARRCPRLGRPRFTRRRFVHRRVFRDRRARPAGRVAVEGRCRRLRSCRPRWRGLGSRRARRRLGEGRVPVEPKSVREPWDR